MDLSHLDVVLLSRFQFAFTVMFHYLFPPLTIGLSVFMVWIEGMYLRTGDPLYESMAKFWTKIFAVNFALGTATGIVMEFEFGTNWATYSRFVGDVFGSALAAEGIFAFFLEAGFLAVLVFGWDKVSKKTHFFSTVMVCLGAIFSSIWIVVANSWQQTPTGYHIVGEGLMARAEITDFWAMVFNPSSVHRLVHVWIGSAILGSFFILSISAFYLLRNRHERFAKVTFKHALVYAMVSSLAAPISGHFQAHMVAKHQPAKLAAFEGHYKTAPGDLYLFGMPNDRSQRVDLGVKLPGFLSWLIHGNTSVPLIGLDQILPGERPPVAMSFWSYHLMVWLGGYFIVLCMISLVFLVRGSLFRSRALLWTWVFSVLGAFAANQLGWVAAEVGRQPWIVYGLLRTSEAHSTSVKAAHVLGSILMFAFIYLLLFILWIFVLNDKIQHGPEEASGNEKGGLLDAMAYRGDSTHSLTETRHP